MRSVTGALLVSLRIFGSVKNGSRLHFRPTRSFCARVTNIAVEARAVRLAVLPAVADVVNVDNLFTSRYAAF